MVNIISLQRQVFKSMYNCDISYGAQSMAKESQVFVQARLTASQITAHHMQFFWLIKQLKSSNTGVEKIVALANYKL